MMMMSRFHEDAVAEAAGPFQDDMVPGVERASEGVPVNRWSPVQNSNFYVGGTPR